MRKPPLLHAGARVALVAPAGPLRENDLERAIANAESLGWVPVPAPHVTARTGYLAGDDAVRLADLNRVAADDSIDGVWCVRGGYGTMRIVDGIDFAAWRRRPKALIGYSDITALHTAIGARAGIVTYHGPTARSELTPFTRRSFARAVTLRDEPCGPADAAFTLMRGRARGTLVGGNLSLISATMGTPFAPGFEGAIVVLEDVNEAVYRVDRMLTQLRLSGALDKCAAIVFGGFTDIPPEPGDAERPLDAVLREFAERTKVPCIGGAPIGHLSDHWTVPLGASATLDADTKTLTIE